VVVSKPAPAELPAFDQHALELFALQFKHNAPYRRLCESRGARPDTVAHWTAIPAAPTSAFKEFELSCLPVAERTTLFRSSGTTERRPSRHFHNAESLALYETSLLAWFNANFKLPIGNWQLAILTPPPAEAPHSSLVHMFDTIQRRFGSSVAPFFGRAAGDGAWTIELEAAAEFLRKAGASEQPLLVLGTAFSYVHLLDHLADRDLRFELPPGSCALETGGYKGRSRSLPRAALHALISQRLGIAPGGIACEYGMSELSSQAYDLGIAEAAAISPAFASSNVSFPLTPALSRREREDRRPRAHTLGALGNLVKPNATLPLPRGEGRGEGERSIRPQGAVTSAIAAEAPHRCFHFPPWAQAQIISPETGCAVTEGETGLIRIFDLANVYSVMAIQTEDLGTRRGDGFALAGRAVLAESRGCSLMAV
jgi:hypothetical protein